MSSVTDAVVADIAARRDELVALATQLIAFDTTAREVTDPPRDEAALQALIAGRLKRAGAEVELWEPRPEDVAGTGQVPDGVGFAGRPQLLARLRGAAPGRTFLLNGHIDAVSYEPREAWSSDPLRAEVRDGRLCGRGAADMKGGVAAIVIAAEALARAGLPAGELLVSTVTDEESWGAGSLASVAHGVRADGGLVPEFTGFDAWLACRGVMSATVTVEGRPGHAEEAQPDWRAGGAVNAIDKATVVLDGVRRLRDDWQGRPEHEHRFLPAPDIVTTMISGGEWWVSYPARCTVTLDITYLPAQADEAGGGGAVRAEIERWIAAAAALDPWLAAHPPVVEWGVDLPPAEVDEDHEVVRGALAAARAVGRTGQPGALSSWHDAAVFTRVGGTPTISFGPDGTDGAGRPLAHAVDESVLVDDLVACSQALAIATLTFLEGTGRDDDHRGGPTVA